MIGWESTYSRDYAEAVVNGYVDRDLERMINVVEERVQVRDGTKRCPECGELLLAEHAHDGFVVSPTKEKT